MNRSTKGCWTCRLRHRKCDEAVPTCGECKARHIQCHGYGPKPAWMNDDDALHAELLRIKRAVKENFRAARKLHNSRVGATCERGASSLQSLTTTPAPAAEESPQASAPSNDMTFRDMQLLMHYLDHIYPLQFQYYEDNPHIGGRGWLFWLLMKNGPLYQAALSLAALHQHNQLGHRSGSTTRNELVEYHTRALQGLQRVLLRQGRAEGFAADAEQLVEFLACGTFLISFEVFQGAASDWQLHLTALASVVQNMEPCALTVTSSSSGVDVARRFLIMNTIWFDVLACVSTGAAPRIPHREWLSVEGIDMPCIMGCQNWAMMAIGDIAAANAKGPLAETDTILEIKRSLDEGLEELDVEHEADRESTSNSRCITRTFATAALVQLHTIWPIADLPVPPTPSALSSPSASSSAIQSAVARVMGAVGQLPQMLSKRSLVWPICVAGCMAAPDQQPFFEDLMEGILEKGARGFGNCETVLHVMRKAWAYRDPARSEGKMAPWPWEYAMDQLNICALLV